ncbi:MAG: hypothetical protein SVR08_13335 [Spirochaetota bacterium]|nr:hypothetical protein [Spirochaetota bacterium]
MKAKQLIAYTIILLVYISSNAFGEIILPAVSTNNYNENYANFAIEDSKQFLGDKAIEEESPFRRFEITFFISLPFVFIACFATIHIYGVISEGDFNVNVWGDYSAPLIISALGINSGIAFREAYICHRSNNERRKMLKKPSLNLSYFKRY